MARRCLGRHSGGLQSVILLGDVTCWLMWRGGGLLLVHACRQTIRCCGTVSFVAVGIMHSYDHVCNRLHAPH